MKHFPAQALFFLQAPSLQQLYEGLASTPILKMLLQPQLRGARSSLVNLLMLSPPALQFSQNFGMGPFEVLNLFQGEGALAVYLLEKEGQLDPKLAVSIELGEERQKILQLLEKLDRFAAQEGARVDPVKVLDRPAVRWSTEGEESFSRAVLGTHLVLTLEKAGAGGLLEGIAGLYSGKEDAGKGLGDDPPFKAPWERCSVTRRSLFMSGDLQRLIALAPGMLNPEGEDDSLLNKALAYSGIKSLRSLSYALGFHGGEMEGRLQIKLEGGGKGLLPLFLKSLGPVSGAEEALGKIPASAESIAALRVSWGKLLEGALREARRQFPEEEETISIYIQRLEAAGGISFTEEVFKLEPLTVYEFSIPPPAGSLFPDSILIASAKELSGYLKLLEKFSAESKRVLEVNGKKIHIGDFGTIADTLLEGMGPGPQAMVLRSLFTPVLAWCEIDGDWVAISNQPQSLRRYVEIYAKEKSAAADPALLALAKEHLEGAPLGSILRGGRGVVSTYNSAVSALNWLAPSFDRFLSPQGIDLGLLLPGEDFLGSISAGALRVEVAPDQLDLHGHGVATAAIGSSEPLVPVAVASVAAGFLIPTLLRGRVDAYEVQCANNLKELGKLAIIYADASGTRFFPHSPEGGIASLQVMVDFYEGDVKPQLFVCPRSEQDHAEVAGEGKFKLSEDTCSYEMVPLRLSPTDSGRILIYERFPHHRGKRHVVYTDTAIGLLSESVFQDEMEKARPKGEEK
ncbi:MAG: hypothetical protein HY717_19145 [Planctomycetes bacterium]|nr:hypothetical protein [Planctomycetota bacterium]